MKLIWEGWLGGKEKYNVLTGCKHCHLYTWTPVIYYYYYWNNPSNKVHTYTLTKTYNNNWCQFTEYKPGAKVCLVPKEGTRVQNRYRFNKIHLLYLNEHKRVCSTDHLDICTKRCACILDLCRGMRNGFTSLISRPPHPAFVACSTKIRGKAWKDLSHDACHCWRHLS